MARVLDSYNQSNAMNLVALTALGLQLEERPPEASSPIDSFDGVVASGAGPSVEGPLPGLLGLEQMTPATSELVRQLDRLGDQGDGRIRASMYRHLAHWPGFLELAWRLIAPLDGDGRLRELIDAASHLARGSSLRVARRLAGAGLSSVDRDAGGGPSRARRVHRGRDRQDGAYRGASPAGAADMNPYQTAGKAVAGSHSIIGRAELEGASAALVDPGGRISV